MKLRHLILLVFTLIFLSGMPAEAAGFLPVRNFGRDFYRGGAQNWSVVQDSIGRIYVANRDGMLRFDGQRWHKFMLSNYTTVRSMMFDPTTGRIYAGGSEEFGYFSTDSLCSDFRYTTLTDKFRGMRPSFTEVWNIFKRGERIYFQSDNHLFCYEGSDVVSYEAPGRIARSAAIAGVIYVALEDGNLYRFNGTAFDRLPGTERLHGKKIAALLPLSSSGDLLIATSVNGLYTYDGDSVTLLDTDISDFLRENQVFCAASDGDDYIFGTVNRGAVVKNLATGRVSYINKETGLQNNTVLGAMFDNTHNIWLSLDNGLDYVLYNSPVSILVGAQNAVGAGYVSRRKGDKVFFGTNQGLYSAAYPFGSSPSPVSLKRELHGQIWSIDGIGDDLFVGGDAGLFVLSGGGFSRVANVPGTYSVSVLRNDRSLALVSSYDGFYMLGKTGAQWHNLGRIEGYDDIGGKFVEDLDGYIWMPHWRKGVYRLRLNRDTRRFEEKILVDTTCGLPTAHNNTVTLYGGRLIIAAEDGYYNFDNATMRLNRDESLSAVIPVPVHGPLTVLPGGSLAVAASSGIDIARRNPDGRFVFDDMTFKWLEDKLMPGYVNINEISPGELIVSNQDGFWDMSLNTPPAHGVMPRPFVNTVYANLDSLVYQAPSLMRDDVPLRLPYELNAVRFEFGCPEYSGAKNIEFSSFLENYDEDWTPYSRESTREYAKLSEGRYKFKLRARNKQTGQVSESEYSFEILPPWYRSLPAKIIYVLFGVMLCVSVWMLVKRWIRQTKKQIDQKRARELDDLRRKSEQEALVKDYEIATLKSEQLEHDILHKSQELSSTTMNLVRKNEMLREIVSKISRLQALPGLDSVAQRHLVKLQNSIEDNISHDDEWKTINQNFDIVYENYTKRLMELHPNLSASDKRMCCYIKMGLSSKEIAPLLNISYKSVEMARYRLRKKMGIVGERSLSDYLANL